MTGLWIGIGLLVLLGSLFLLWPVLRTRRLTELLAEQQHARQLANVRIYKQKLAQLEQDRADGQLQEEDYQQFRMELENTLLQDADSKPGQKWLALPGAMRASVLVLTLLACLFGSWGLYSAVGSVDGLKQHALQQEIIHEGEQDFMALMRRLENAVASNPDDIRGWSLLARFYFDLGQAEPAARALQEMLRIQGPSSLLLAQLAEAYYFADNGVMTERVQTAVDQALALNANEPAVFRLLGMNAYQQRDWQAAIDHWQQALAHMDIPELRDSLLEGINAARAQLGQAPLEAPPVAGFELELSLSQAASLLTHPNASVFVYATPVGETGAPLAVTHLQVADLPLRLSLNDQHALNPARNFSTLPAGTEIIIYARVALGGTPEPQSGDWQGQTEVLTLDDATQPVTLQINQQL